MFPESVQSILRQSLVNLPGVGLPGYESNVETQIVTNRSDGAYISDTLRERDRESISVVALIWFPVIFIAFDLDIRTSFINNVAGFFTVPTLLLEFFKKVRLSRIGTSNMRFGLNVSSCREFIIRNPDYKGTFLDIDFMSTKTGQRRWLEFVTLVASFEGNYISVSSMSELQKIELSSKETTTFLALTVQNLSSIENAIVNLLPQHSFGDNINGVHIVDALFSGVTHTLNGKEPILGEIVKGFSIQTDLLSFAHHAIERVTGRQTNPGKGRKQTPPSGDKHSDVDSSNKGSESVQPDSKSSVLLDKLDSGTFVKRPTFNKSVSVPPEFVSLFYEFIKFIGQKRSYRRGKPSYGF
jgi:hypothetical protein